MTHSGSRAGGGAGSSEFQVRAEWDKQEAGFSDAFRKRLRAAGVLCLAGSRQRGAQPPGPTVGQVAAPLHGGPALTTSIWIN